MENTLRTDAVVIGSGPGGYVCGIRLGQLGKQVIVVEKDEPGGICLNVGCIPSKALITAAKTYDKFHGAEAMGLFADNVRVDMGRLQAWKGDVVKKLTGGVQQLLKGAGAKLLFGSAEIVGPNRVSVKGKDGAVTIIEAGAIVVATGSRPIQIPGFAIDNKNILDSTGALALTEVPKRLVVIGGGYIGLELGMMYAKIGSKVTVVEGTPQLLPGNDPELVSVVARKMKKLGMETHLEAMAKGWAEKNGSLEVTFTVKGAEQKVECDKVLVTVGRRPNSENLGLEKVGVKVERGFVPTDRQMRTNVPSIFAIGDVAGQPMLAHKASKEGEVAAEVIAGHRAEQDALVIPAVIFTDPEISTVGMSEQDAQKAGRKVKVGKYPFGGLGRAMTQMETDGFVKIVSDEKDDLVLGVQIVGPGASDLISEATLAIEMGAATGDLALTVHPHPTLGEAVMESAKALLGESPHLVGGGARKR